MLHYYNLRVDERPFYLIEKYPDAKNVRFTSGFIIPANTCKNKNIFLENFYSECK